GVFDAAESAAARFRLLAEMTEFLMAAARDAKGLVVVVEDLHDADEASLALLRQVVREGEGSWLLLVGSHRDVNTGQDALAGTLAEVTRSRATATVGLAPFTS